MSTIGYAGDSGAERNESALWTNLGARAVGVGSVHRWLVSKDAPKETVDFVKLWLGKIFKPNLPLRVYLSIPMIKGTVDAIQNPFYKPLAVEVNHSDWISATRRNKSKTPGLKIGSNIAGTERRPGV